MLQVEGLSCGYGAATVASDVTLEVKSAQMVALIGPNGAGKTTLLQCLAGHLAQIGRAHV